MLDPDLIGSIESQLRQHAEAAGLIEKVEQEVKQEARTALDAMTPLERDTYGFTSRNVRRLQLAEPFISHIPPSSARVRRLLDGAHRARGDRGDS